MRYRYQYFDLCNVAVVFCTSHSAVELLLHSETRFQIREVLLRVQPVALPAA